VKEKVSITLDERILKELDSIIDGIRIKNKSQAIEFLIRRSLSEKRSAVVLAGGDEEHLRVNGTYKPLVKIKGKTVIERMIETLRKNKIFEIFIVGRKNVLSEIMKSVGDGSRYGADIKYVEENEDKYGQQDTAKTLKLLKGKIKRTFLVIFCDIIFDYDLNIPLNFHIKEGDVATLLLKTSGEPIKWGVVELDGKKITKFVEKPKRAESYLVYTGIFIAEPEIFSLTGNSLEYEIFPYLAKNRLLSGYVCSGKCEHVHKI